LKEHTTLELSTHILTKTRTGSLQQLDYTINCCEFFANFFSAKVLLANDYCDLNPDKSIQLEKKPGTGGSHL
jgi:hypothetical protein